MSASETTGAAAAAAPPLDQLVRMFLAAALPRAQWTHAAHLRVGAWHVRQFGAAEALPRLRDGIRRLNQANGTPNTPTGGYHETITAAYVALIAQSLAAADPALPFEAQIERLVNGPFGDRALLLRFWTEEILMSPAARAAWVPPDRAPLDLSDLWTGFAPT